MVGRYALELTMILLYGMGLPAAAVAQIGGAQAVVQLSKLIYAGDLMYITIVTLVQLSILHYLLFKFQQRGIKGLTYGLMALCLAVWFARLIATAIICVPKGTTTDANVNRKNRQIVHLGSNISEIVLDGCILLLPIPTLYNMRLSWIRKFGLGVMYILGLGETISPSMADEHGSEIIPGNFWKQEATIWDMQSDSEIQLSHLPMAKKLSELANGQIKVIFNWDVHSARNSARLYRSSMHT
ncbi:hypothetical protein N7495_000364 [Penicillium taxi]|uniref:uncharacterized protein n=1 Tax=Penicillium taxi TaxID=168475 RepID=UPI002544EF21|nr:uncharacterized protein N7495_000364 [Penicillium taxi]KAJ5907682.1 hypothetical protein N7495_000364 [Penicillium taxi]